MPPELPPTDSDAESPVLLPHGADAEVLPAYLSLPSEGAGPGIILLYEDCRDSESVRELGKWYGSHGFAVICPLLRDISPQGVNAAVDACAAAMGYLEAHPSCLGSVCAVGFGEGAKLSYLLAKNHKPACAVAYYGVGLEHVITDNEPLNCPFLLHVAGKDSRCSPEAQAKIRSSLGNDPQVRLHDYPGQDHGFAKSDHPGYHAKSAELADLRTLAFLVKYLV